MNISRKRSVVWGFFKAVDAQRVQCVLCRSFLFRKNHGSTTSMLRHLRIKHPTVVSWKSNGRVVEITDSNGPQDLEEDGAQFCSVEVVLEDGDSDKMTTVKETEISSAINGFLETSQGGRAKQIAHAEVSDDRPARRTRQRSFIWRYFERLDGLNVARCRICMKKLKWREKCSTSNLHRHMSKRHPKLFSELVANGQHPPPVNAPQQSHANCETDETRRAMEQEQVSVEMELEDKDSDTVNEPDINSDINGIFDTLQRDPVEDVTHEEASDNRPVRRTRHRSLIWRHFERLDSLNAARCRICMKKLKCCDVNATSNLRKHMLKRHPDVFSELVAHRKHPPLLNSSQDSNTNCDMDETFTATEQRQVSAALQDSRASEGERRVFRRERELIEALRRAQKEEARTLEHQRELLEKLRAASAREAAAEREKIEFLRKAQQEEAKDLSRQREELQKEKAELQKKWEELQQERELLLISRGQEAS